MSQDKPIETDVGVGTYLRLRALAIVENRQFREVIDEDGMHLIIDPYSRVGGIPHNGKGPTQVKGVDDATRLS